MQDINPITAGTFSPGISCPKCRTRIDTYGQRNAAFFGCRECGSFFENSGGDKNILSTFPAGNKFQPVISLGTRAVMEGVEYTMIGFMQKIQSDDDSISWNEYAFHDPSQQWYVILAEYDGHWMMVWHAEDQNIEARRSITAVDRAYKGNLTLDLCLQYQFRIAYAEGAFDWNILDDERITTYEYANPPALLVHEVRDSGSEWFDACYMSPAAIRKMMDVPPENFPERFSTVKFTPATFYPAWKALLKFTGILLAVFLGINLFLLVFKPAKTVCQTSFRCQADSAASGTYKAEVSTSFTIDGHSPVEIKMSCDLIDNNWIELPVALINDQDGRVWEADKTIEYYHGWEDGESWSEGSREQTVVFSSIPAGSYHLNLYPAMEPRIDGPLEPDVAVTVTQNVFMPENFWLMLLALITYPLIQLFRKYFYENSKWFDSEYGSLPNQ